METSDFQFSIEIIDKIYNFYNSTDELLLLCGFSGCAKSEIVNKTLENPDEDTLIFRHLCFENTTIDDFLLNFYDSFRKYSLEKKVSLKKSMGESFKNKVSFYFKNIDKKCIIAVDNFELVKDNIEILNFLHHIASFENTKLVLISKENNIDFFINRELPSQIIEITPYTKEAFKEKIKNENVDIDEQTQDKLFECTQGHRLYFRMISRYCEITGIKIPELLLEYEKRENDFENFITLKLISLIPSVYFQFLKNLSSINHVVSTDFIKYYNLGDIKQIEYLERNYLISKYDNNIILRNYFKQYFAQTLSLQEKYEIFSNLVNIYEEELTKSPRDRLLRLSRESIRKQIEVLEKNIPAIKKQSNISNNNFSYISLSQEGSNPWFDKKEMDRKQKYLDKKRELQNKKLTPKKITLSEEDAIMLKEYRQKKYEEERIEKIKNEEFNFLEEFKKADELEQNYQYVQANEILSNLKSKTDDTQTKIEILEHLARNSEKLNNYEHALDYYTQVSSLHLLLKDYEKYFKTVLEVADLYKNLYRFSSAKDEYFKIINSEQVINNSLKALAYLGLGDVFESENSIEKALEYYHLAGNFANPQNASTLCEIYFKTAILYDDMHDFDNAKEFYTKNINTSYDTTQNKWLSQSYINLGLIYSYENNINEAKNYIKLALETDKKDKNQAGIYFAARELSKIYEVENLELAIDYLKEALECAKQIHDEFKEAFAYLELGDLYYNFNQDELALISFFEAKKALGENILEENKQIIEQRINDMKIKMLPSEFQRIEANYV